MPQHHCRKKYICRFLLNSWYIVISYILQYQLLTAILNGISALTRHSVEHTQTIKKNENWVWDKNLKWNEIYCMISKCDYLIFCRNIYSSLSFIAFISTYAHTRTHTWMVRIWKTYGEVHKNCIKTEKFHYLTMEKGMENFSICS